MRNVINGERLSGHRTGAGTTYPEILILDRPEYGSMICTIESFHWADVTIKGKTIELCFEGKVDLAIRGGVVQYAESEPENPAVGPQALSVLPVQ
jgi:hypothetical protein